ncbi:hypothetical protein G6F36_013601 [Rhizopus arrhizus]|nr:hypothetical protein G6F36_013601 [Rhizopus arrhizus]
MDDDRLAVIREKQRTTGLMDESIEFLSMANRTSTIRAAIYSVYKILHPDQGNLVDQRIIADFFRPKKQQTIVIPKRHQLQTWDSDDLTTLIVQRYNENEKLQLPDLRQKTLLLLALATMARPRSDLGRLQNRDVLFDYDDKNQVTKMTIHFRQPKGTQVKTFQL